jgi:competence protein ComEC
VPLGHVFALVVLLSAAAALLTNVEPNVVGSVAVAALAVAIACRSTVRIVAACVAVGGLSAASASVARERALSIDDHGIGSTSGRPPIAGSGEILFVEGRLARDAVVSPDDAARLLVDITSIERGGERIGVRGRVQAFVAGAHVRTASMEWIAGRIVRAPMALRHPAVLRNPGGWNVRWQTLRRGFHLNGTIKSAWLVNTREGRWWTEMAGKSRRAIRQAIQASSANRSSETAAILSAILLGDRAGLSPELEDRLQRAGTYHVIAISGGNIALLVIFALGLARLVFRSEAARLTLVLAIVLSYGAMVGGDPSVNRATLAATLYLVSRISRLSPSPTHVIALVAALVATVSPLEVLAPGAWLSYVATLAIIVLPSSLRDWAHAGLGLRHWRGVVMAGAGVLLATISVEVLLFPVSASLFGRVGIANLILNFVAIPSMAMVQASGMAAVALAFLWMEAAQTVTGVSQLAVSAIVDSARLVDLVPWLSWRVISPGWFWVMAYYSAVIATWNYRHHQVRRRVGGVATVLCAAGLLISPEKAFARPDAGTLRLTMLDVGQGESLLLQFPTGQSLLVDSGNATSTFDVGERVVVPAVHALGVRRLNWLAITHPDLDHIGGAQAVALALDPLEVWEAIPVPTSTEREALRDWVVQKGRVWRQLQKNDHLEVGEVSIEILHPPWPDWERRRVRNDDSAVLRVSYRSVELLLTGDVGDAVEKVLPLTRDRPLRVLKVAHHGSRSSTGSEFVSRHAPTLGLISAGVGNVFGHPAPAVLQTLARQNARVFRTDRSGAIIVEINDAGLRVRTWAGDSWNVALWRSSS